MHKHIYLFKTFLVVYGAFLLAHLWQEGFETYLLAGALFGGLAVAVAAHKNHGYAPLLFLFVHMLIEWYGHAMSLRSYSHQTIALHSVHTLLDITFLYVEISSHYKKYLWPILLSVLVVLAGVFLANYSPGSLPTPLQHNDPWQEMVHYLVLGGMLGCVVSHLFLGQRLRHTHT